MDRFFAPRHVAIAGASNTTGKLGNSITQRLLAGNAGRVYPINPHEQMILGLPSYPDPASVPEPIDLMIALLPGDRLLPLVESCREGQVGFMLAIPSGFAEASVEGQRLQLEIVEAARQRGTRIVGPNSMGVVNAANHLNASLVPDIPPGGPGFSCVTQSGGFGIAVSMYALDHQLSIAKICDLGNTSDIQVPEVLGYLKEDPETRVVGLFLEALGDTEALFDALTDLAPAKPVILTTPGRTEAGRRASLAHLGIPTETGKGAASEIRGLIRARTGRELLHIAKGLTWQPVPRGPRAAIVTATGGIGTELADLCIDFGLEVPKLSDREQRQLTALLPSFAARSNPIDVTPIYQQFAEIYPAVMRILLNADEIDLLIISITDVATELEQLALSIVEALQYDESTSAPIKPTYIFWGSRDDTLANMRLLERARLPCYRSTLETARTAAALAQYNKGRANLPKHA